MARISDLLDELVCIIVSSLLAKSAAFTRIFSKKWPNLFTIELDSNFDQSSNNNGENFKNFVDGLLNRHASCRIRRFSLKLQSLDKSQIKLVNVCLRNVLKRGIMDLELDINVQEGDDYQLPLEFFTCKTVEKLKLGSGFVINYIPKKASLPSLKTLVLNTVRFDDINSGCAFTGLLSACPVIDELVINGFNWEDWYWSRTVSSQSLKRLTIHRGNMDFHDLTEADTMSFDTPNLTYLEYDDILLYQYPNVNLSSLVEANLSFTLRGDENDYNLMNLTKGLKNVEILHLDAYQAMKRLFYDFSEEVSVFENLIDISVITDAEHSCWYGLRVLLAKSPKIETLTLEGDLHSFYYNEMKRECVCECLGDYAFLLTLPIKVLNIINFRGDIGDIVHVRHVLKKLLHLDVLELDVVARGEEKDEILTKLLKIPTASSTCKILCKPDQSRPRKFDNSKRTHTNSERPAKKRRKLFISKSYAKCETSIGGERCT